MTRGNRCSVAICKSHSGLAKSAGEKLAFFSFPKDPNIKKQWIQKCYRKDKWNPDTGRICGKHFSSDDFEDALQAALMNLTPKRLKKTAVPSLHLLPEKIQAAPPKERNSKYFAERDRKALVGSLIRNSLLEDEKHLQIHEGEKADVEKCSIQDPLIDSKEIEQLNKTIRVLEEENKELKQENKILTNKVTMLQENVTREEGIVRCLEAKIACLEQQLGSVTPESNFENEVKTIFKRTLTENQVDIILNKKTKARWTQDELNTAFTIRYLSKRCYIFLRDTINFPLPGLSTLKKWAGNIQLFNGILDDVLRIMKVVGETKSSFQRVIALSFDEIKVASMYEYATKEDEVLGPYSYMQVIMARGLFENWKQPVYIGFDEKMTKKLLNDVVSKLHEIHYDVVACVSDCGGGNQGLWKELNISIDNNFLLHPITGEKIYIFADVPHLLKLLRNWFLDKGFILKDGIVNKDPLQCLIYDANVEINSCHKLSKLHLTCEKAQRQNVKLAAQLLSRTTAVALKTYLPGSDPNLAKRTSEFIELTNNWFDIMNSYTVSESVPTKKPFGVLFESQTNTLNQMIKEMENLKCSPNQKGLQIFQKGIIISSKSIQNLYEDMKHKYKINYILTHRLNQDCLENFFSQIRTRGGLHDHPSPLNALYRLRMILLGKNPGIVQKQTNVLPVAEDVYLMASVLQKANIKLPETGTQEMEAENHCNFVVDTEIGNLPMKSGYESDGLRYIAGYLAKNIWMNSLILGIRVTN